MNPARNLTPVSQSTPVSSPKYNNSTPNNNSSFTIDPQDCNVRLNEASPRSERSEKSERSEPAYSTYSRYNPSRRSKSRDARDGWDRLDIAESERRRGAQSGDSKNRNSREPPAPRSRSKDLPASRQKPLHHSLPPHPHPPPPRRKDSSDVQSNNPASASVPAPRPKDPAQSQLSTRTASVDNGYNANIKSNHSNHAQIPQEQHQQQKQQKLQQQQQPPNEVQDTNHVSTKALPVTNQPSVAQTHISQDDPASKQQPGKDEAQTQYPVTRTGNMDLLIKYVDELNLDISSIVTDHQTATKLHKPEAVQFFSKAISAMQGELICYDAIKNQLHRIPSLDVQRNTILGVHERMMTAREDQKRLVEGLFVELCQHWVSERLGLTKDGVGAQQDSANKRKAEDNNHEGKQDAKRVQLSGDAAPPPAPAPTKEPTKAPTKALTKEPTKAPTKTPIITPTPTTIENGIKKPASPLNKDSSPIPAKSEISENDSKNPTVVPPPSSQQASALVTIKSEFPIVGNPKNLSPRTEPTLKQDTAQDIEPSEDTSLIEHDTIVPESSQTTREGTSDSLAMSPHDVPTEDLAKLAKPIDPVIENPELTSTDQKNELVPEIPNKQVTAMTLQPQTVIDSKVYDSIKQEMDLLRKGTREQQARTDQLLELLHNEAIQRREAEKKLTEMTYELQEQQMKVLRKDLEAKRSEALSMMHKAHAEIQEAAAIAAEAREQRAKAMEESAKAQVEIQLLRKKIQQLECGHTSSNVAL
ncbi:hypothetical protein BGZ76_009704 [Entomortierella beljakovae]|nr:hypothetical protein BGZ76_009704 [Entomortierella beljakovae]